MYKDNNDHILRLNKDLINIDSVHHNNGMISKSFYAKEINKILAVDLYSDVFIVYNNDCKMEHKFQPTSHHLRG